MTQVETAKLIPYRKGIPTKLDVERLIAKFGVPAIGSTINYADIEEVLGCNRKSHRFGTVTNAWRKRLDREHNLILAGNREGAFEVLPPHRRVNYASSGFKQGLRKVTRAADIAVRTSVEALNAEERRVVDHIVTTSGTLISMAHAAAKDIGRPKLGLVCQNSAGASA